MARALLILAASALVALGGSESAGAATSCGQAQASGNYAHKIRGHRVGCRAARTLARAYLRRCRGRNCTVRRYRCRSNAMDFPAAITCRKGQRRKVTFVFDVFP